MSVEEELPPTRGMWPSNWFARLVARPDVQSIVSRLPFAQALARKDGEEIFDILQGFVASQVLMALVELGLLRRLLDAPESSENLALSLGLPRDRLERLLRAGVALRLLRIKRNGRYSLARRGAAILGVPGLEAMIQHNRAFYEDLLDPKVFLQGEEETNLQRFWPYVFGQSGRVKPDVAERYSDLMAQSQVLVAQDTLRMVSLKGITHLMDIGGGSGMFMKHVLRKYDAISGTLFDLPEVLPAAEDHLSRESLIDRVRLLPGSFRETTFPRDVDAISLIRVLYDHDDASVLHLVQKIFDTLPAGGRLIISEPMAGDHHADRVGDVYFALYTMAMGTGKTRSRREISEICTSVGFVDVRTPKVPRPYITSALICSKPG